MDKKYLDINLDRDSAYPLANQLARRLTWMIAEGNINEGDVLPNIREFAEALGINLHTVRAAYHQLEDQDMVSIRPHAGTIVRQYVPFKHLSRSESPVRFIAVILPSLSDFYNQIMEGILHVLETEGMIPVAIPCSEDPYYADAIYKTLSAGDYAGAINISIGFSDEYLEILGGQIDMKTPLIFVDNPVDFGHRIQFNNRKAISDVTGHLIRHGYRKIALINLPEGWSVGQEIAAGFRQAMEGSGFEIDPSKIYTVQDFSYDAGKFGGERMLAEKDHPQAVVAAGDALALGALSAIKAAGLQVPQDIAVCGVDDIQASAISDPPLTTVALPKYEIGEESARIMLEILNSSPRNWVNETFEGELKIRKSCGC